MKKKVIQLLLVIVLSLSGLILPLQNTLIPVYAGAGDQLDINGDFSLTETGPWEPTHVSSNTYQDAEMWADNLKPLDWNFQMWPVSAAPANFKAALVNREGINFIDIDVTNKALSSEQSFLKRMAIEVVPDTAYELSALVELINITNGTLKIKIERLDSSGKAISSVSFDLGTSKKDCQEYHFFFNSLSVSEINMIVLLDGSSRGAYSIGQVELSEYGGEVRDITMDTETLYLELGSTKTLSAVMSPDLASNKTVIWSSDNEDVLSVNASGQLTSHQIGSATITACAESDPSLCVSRKVNVYDDGILPEDAIIILEDTLETGEKRFLDFVVEPMIARRPESVSWLVQGDAAIINEEGWLEAVKPGEVEIILTLADENLDTPLVVSKTLNIVTDTTEQDYLKIRNQWVERIIGNEEMWLSGHEAIHHYIENLSNESRNIFASMYKSNERQENTSLPLWDNEAGETASAHMTTQFRKLHRLAQAFTTKGTDLYQNPEVFNEIVAGFDYMLITKKYGDMGSYSGNWWDWQIGSAQPFSEALLLLDEYLSEEQTSRYAKAIERYAWDPSKQISGAYPSGINATGANRGDIALSTLAVGVLLEDETLVNKIPEHIPSIWKYVTSNDGFYTDGSFVQHGNIAYTGSYGVELIRSVSALIAMTENTRWELSSTEDFDNLNTIVPNSYLPIVHKGQMMAMLMGRSVSRAPGLNKYAPAFSGGAELAANLLIIEEALSESTAQLVKEHVKSWMQDAKPYYDYIANARDFEMLANLINLEEDASITADISKYTHFFGLMARGLYRSDTFTAGLALTSYRMANFEGGVGSGAENKKGWHSGDGMLYIYNNDLTMFGEAYWPTLDYYRLPGITVDTRPLEDNEGQGKTSSNQRWVGGVSDGKNAAMGLDIDKSKQMAAFDLKAKKSYFFINDQIILLGSSISGTSPDTIETIVENRLLNELASNTVSFNGLSIDDFTGDVLSGDWLHLRGIDQEASFGYVFLNENNISIQKTHRSGSYAAINGVFATDDEYEADYFLVNVNHGASVSEGKYAYIVLPGKSVEETAAYSEADPIAILRQDHQAHVIYDKENKVMMINYFDSAAPLVLEGLSDLGLGLEKLEISGGSGVSLMISLNNKSELVYTIANPNMDGKVTKLTATMTDGTLVQDDTTIADEAQELGSGRFELNFNSDGRPGTSWSLRYAIALDMSALEALVNALHEEAYTKASWTEFLETGLLAKAQEMIDAIGDEFSEPTSQQDIDRLYNELSAASADLMTAGDFKDLDRTVTVILAQKNQYTSYSFGLLEQEINKIAAMKEARSSQVEIDAHLELIKELIQSLEAVIDFKEANQWISTHPIEEDYTESSLSVYQAALKAYQVLVEAYDPSQPLKISQAEVDTALSQLQEAYAKLVRTIIEEASKLVEEAKRVQEEYPNSKELAEATARLEDLIAKELSTDAIRNAMEEVQKLIANLRETGGSEVGKLPDTGISSHYAMVGVASAILALGLVLVFVSRKKRT